MDGPTGWTSGSDWVRTSNDGRRGASAERRALETDRCRQCRFPWFLHPERYDARDAAMIRFCSEFPVEPIRAVEACIVP